MLQAQPMYLRSSIFSSIPQHARPVMYRSGMCNVYCKIIVTFSHDHTFEISNTEILQEVRDRHTFLTYYPIQSIIINIINLNLK